MNALECVVGGCGTAVTVGGGVSTVRRVRPPIIQPSRLDAKPANRRGGSTTAAVRRGRGLGDIVLVV